MAKMYQYYEFDNLPKFEIGKAIETDKQLPLSGVRPSSIHTKIVYQGRSDHDEFDKFFVEHETEHKNILWRGDNGERRHGGFIEIMEFHMYRHKDGYYFIAADHQIIHEMCRRLLLLSGELIVRRREIDLPTTKDELQARVSGGYFGSLTVEKVSAVSIFGPDVGESGMWD